MAFVAWICLGLITGFIGSRIVNKGGSSLGMSIDVALGVAGAVIAGALLNMADVTGLRGFTLWSMFVTVAGAVVVLVTYHAVARTGNA